MNKLKMQTINKADENFKRLTEMFPNAITETIDENGEVVRAIDKDVLMQEISCKVVEGREERYQFTWPDKRKSVLLANAPINKTLRPCREESVNFDNTENLYIEGDNLEVLKLLQETYLGKIKMIYIDPPYNTGNDFVYEDNFTQSTDEYLANSGQYDDQGNRLYQNTESNGRFHTDWLNMIYPRLKLAKDLLREDGMVFISIDDNEQENLKKICDEIFGSANFVANFIWKKTSNPNSTGNNIGVEHEYIISYSKSNKYILNSLPLDKEDFDKYIGKDEFLEERGPYKLVGLNKTGTVNDLRANLMYDIEAPDGSIIKPNPRWRWSLEKFNKCKTENRIVFIKYNEKWSVSYKQYLNEDTEGNIVARGKLIKTIFSDNGRTTDGTLEINSLLGKGYFDFPKPKDLIKKLLFISSKKNDIILDFFSGSATTAHAVMQLNAEDGGNRKFIMVQLPEVCDEKSEAYKAGYKNICEIGKERIRRAGKKIKDENPLTTQDLDIGFRVLKCDTSNMKDVYYNPKDIEISLFENDDNNIKEDRTPEDLLFQVMLDLGVLLSSKIEEKEIAGKKVFNVADGFLIACFDENVTEETIKEVAKQKPYYFVMRDSSMANDSVATNFEQIFATYSPDTVRKVL